MEVALELLGVLERLLEVLVMKLLQEALVDELHLVLLQVRAGDGDVEVGDLVAGEDLVPQI